MPLKERLIHWLEQRDQAQHYDWLASWDVCLIGEFLRDHQIRFSDFVATKDYEMIKSVCRPGPWIVGAALSRARAA